MFPEIAQLSPAVWGILIAAAAALVVTVVLTCRASSLSTRKMAPSPCSLPFMWCSVWSAR